MPKLTIIIPCYNQANYLPEALQSLLDQTYKDWECIMVNDGSPDNTEEVALEWCKRDKRFKYLNKVNGGLSSARNAGLKIAKGDFIQFLDADDIIENEKLRIQSAILFADESIDLVYSPVRYFTSDNRSLRHFHLNLIDGRWQPEVSGSNKSLFEHLVNQNIFACNCPLIRKKAIDRIGFFNEHLTSHEDYEFWIRLAIKGCFFQFDDTVATFALVRTHDVSMSNDREKMAMGYLFSKYMLFNHLLLEGIPMPLNIEKQIRNFKKELTCFYLENKIKKSQYLSILTPFEKIRLTFLSIIPKRLKFNFMMLDRHEMKRIINRFKK